MKSILFSIVIAIIALLYVAKTSISFNPFRLSVERPLFPAGIVLMSLAMLCFWLDGQKFGRKRNVIQDDEKLKIVWREKGREIKDILNPVFDDSWKQVIKTKSGQECCSCENYAISCDWCITWDQQLAEWRRTNTPRPAFPPNR